MYANWFENRIAFQNTFYYAMTCQRDVYIKCLRWRCVSNSQCEITFNCMQVADSKYKICIYLFNASAHLLNWKRRGHIVEAFTLGVLLYRHFFYFSALFDWLHCTVFVMEFFLQCLLVKSLSLKSRLTWFLADRNYSKNSCWSRSKLIVLR